MNNPILFFVCCLCPIILEAQQVRFSKIYDQVIDREYGVNIFEVNNEYYFASSTKCPPFFEDTTYCSRLTKLDQEGNFEWSKVYSNNLGVKNTMINDFQNIYFAATKQLPERQLYVYCLDLNGEIVWEKELGDPSNPEQQPQICIWGDKIVVAGRHTNFDFNQPTAGIICFILDALGNETGNFTISEQNKNSSLSHLSVDQNGNLLVSYNYCNPGGMVSCFGTSFEYGLTRVDTSLTKFDILNLPMYVFSANGHTLSYGEGDIAVQWFVGTENNYQITPPAILYSDMIGNVQDTVAFYGNVYKSPTNLTITSEKNIIGCGTRTIPFDNISYGWVFKIDSNKQIAWERSLIDTTQGASSGNSFKDIIKTSDGGYLAIGSVINMMSGVNEAHVWVVKLDSMGCLVDNCDSIYYLVPTQEAVYLNGVDIEISPNPADDLVRLEIMGGADLTGLELIVLSTNGSFVTKKTITKNEEFIETQDLSDGIYSLLIMRGNEILQSKKLVILHGK